MPENSAFCSSLELRSGCASVVFNSDRRWPHLELFTGAQLTVYPMFVCG